MYFSIVKIYYGDWSFLLLVSCLHLRLVLFNIRIACMRSSLLISYCNFFFRCVKAFHRWFLFAKNLGSLHDISAAWFWRRLHLDGYVFSFLSFVLSLMSSKAVSFLHYAKIGVKLLATVIWSTPILIMFLFAGQGNYLTLNSNGDNFSRNSGIFWAGL